MLVRRGMQRTPCATPARPMSSGASTASAVGGPGQAGQLLPRLRRAGLAGDGIEGIAPDEVEAGWWVTEDRRNDGIATEAMEAAIDDLFSRTDVETITAYISDGGNEHPAAWQPSSDSRYAAEATGLGRADDRLHASPR